MISVIAAAVPPILAVGVVVWRCAPVWTRRRLIGEAHRLTVGLRGVQPVWRPEDRPDVYRVVQFDQMECLACMGSGEERFRVACRLCDGRGFIDAFSHDLTIAERRR